jgi:glycerol-1-phosphate dehydrogenase [NAD(P)+]
MEITVPSLLRIKPDALHKIGKYLRGESFMNVALYYGEGIKELFENTIRISLETADVKVVHEEVAGTNDIQAIFDSSLRLPTRLDAVVAIGGGKVIDFCKYIAVLRQIPIISVPTLISNDGFCSPFSSLVVTGQRRTVKTMIPHGVILDTNILMSCPAQFLFSGIGDLFCKFTSVYDWKLAFKRKGELVNDFAAVICRNAADTFLYHPQKDFSNLEYLRVIASSLLMSGVAMEIAQSSRPASGSEHLISHAYDRYAKQPSLHGLQVGVASYAVSCLQEETHSNVRACIEQSGFLDFMAQNPLAKDDFKEAIKRAPAVKDDFYTVLSERDAIERLLEFVERDELLRRMVV